jgi:hypothetical protein
VVGSRALPDQGSAKKAFIVMITFGVIAAATCATRPHSDGPPPMCPGFTDGDFTDTPPLRDVPLPGCESIRQESRYCLTVGGLGVQAVGLDSGTVCQPSGAPLLGTDPQAMSIAWRGDALYTCRQGVGLARGSLADGSVEVAGGACNGVTVDTGRLLVAPVYAGPLSRALDGYHTWAARSPGSRPRRMDSAWSSTSRPRATSSTAISQRAGPSSRRPTCDSTPSSATSRCRVALVCTDAQ